MNPPWWVSVTLALATALVAFSLASGQRGLVAFSAVDVTKRDIETVLRAPEGGADRQIRVVDIGKLNLGIGVLHRGQVKTTVGPVRGLVHTQVTEVYYILSGSGTLMTGGEIMDARPMAADSEVVRVAVGPSITGSSKDGVRRIVGPGDVVVIPAGVFHGWVEVPDHVTYLSIRPDPDRVLPAGYVNSAVKR